MTKQTKPSAARIENALKRIDPIFLNSPLLRTETQDFLLLAKDETTNPILSFKGRGTSNFLAWLEPDAPPLVTASAGNFGQGLAYNAARTGRTLTVFASINANPRKIEAMRRFGAEVILEGEDFDAAKASAKAYATANALLLVEDGASAAIAEGAGTIAAELTGGSDDIDVIFVPLGNGALAAGIGCWFKARSLKTRVVAVAARNAPCMALSFEAGEPVSTASADTVADGIAIREPVPQAVGWLQDTVDEVVLVDDEAILEAMRFARQSWNRLVEPAGAAGLAAALVQADRLKGKCVATPLCGGNLTDAQIASWFPAG